MAAPDQTEVIPEIRELERLARITLDVVLALGRYDATPEEIRVVLKTVEEGLSREVSR